VGEICVIVVDLHFFSVAWDNFIMTHASFPKTRMLVVSPSSFDHIDVSNLGCISIFMMKRQRKLDFNCIKYGYHKCMFVEFFFILYT
jgi:hypothetical protein